MNHTDYCGKCQILITPGLDGAIEGRCSKHKENMINIMIPRMYVSCMFCKDNKYHLNSIPHVAWMESPFGTKMRIEWW